jgi:PAS domain S-box-containing protein
MNKDAVQQIEEPAGDTQPVFNVNQPKKILLVDDDIDFLTSASQILREEHNFEVTTVDSVDLALKEIYRCPFDAIVSDYNMPKKTGLELLKILRNSKNETPFLIFTGQGREEVAVTALNLGADRYLDKGTTETVFAELSDAILKSIENKESKRLLKESEERYRTLVESSLQGIFVAQEIPLKAVFVNESFAKTLGYSIEEIISLSPQRIMELVHPDDRAFFFERYAQRLQGLQKGITFDFRAIKKDGTMLWLRVSSNRLIYNGKPAVQGMFLNIQSDKEASENIQKKEARYRELANSLPEMVFETNERGIITFYNQPGCEITGYMPEDLAKGINIIDVIAPEDRAKAASNAQKTIGGQSSGPNEYKLLKKDGTIMPVLAKTARYTLENGQFGLRGILVDITERKLFEKNLAENQKRLQLMNEKLGIVGSLSRHDVRNKICGISGNTYLMKKRFSDTPEVLYYVQNIEHSCREVEKLLDFVRTYEQLGVDKLSYVNLRQVFDDATKLFSRKEQLPAIKNEFEEILVLADSSLTQLFYNLIDNSIKHGKKVTAIVSAFEKLSEDNLVLVYKDDGVGIPFENKGHLFKVGFSTAGSTGYGLYLIKKMVDIYGWSINEIGEPEQGAKFVVTIPATNSNGNKCFKLRTSCQEP